jgi:hypothetical protein
MCKTSCKKTKKCVTRQQRMGEQSRISAWPDGNVFYVFDNRHGRMTQDTRFAQILQLASNCLVASARAHTATVRPNVISNIYVASGIAQAVTGCNFSVAATEICQFARCRVKQCSPSGQLNSSATKVASARLGYGAK